MKEIHLTKNKKAIVDKEDYKILSRFSWYVDAIGYVRTSVNKSGKKSYLRMHNLILPPNQNTFVDHINRNKLDNRKANLRLCTTAQNAQNRGLSSKNTSGYKGVTWRGRHKRWEAKIVADGKSFYIGYFTNKLDAAKAYNKKAMELHGDFAYINMLR